MFGYDIQIQFQANLEVPEALITYITNGGGEARHSVMLHIGAGHSNNCQIGGGGEARHSVMLRIGAGHSNNCQIGGGRLGIV